MHERVAFDRLSRAARQRVIWLVALVVVCASLAVAVPATTAAAATSGHQSAVAPTASVAKQASPWGPCARFLKVPNNPGLVAPMPNIQGARMCIVRQIAVCNNMRHANRHNPHNLYYFSRKVYSQCQAIYRNFGKSVPSGFRFGCKDVAGDIGGILGGLIFGIDGNVPGAAIGGAVGGFAGTAVGAAIC